MKACRPSSLVFFFFSSRRRHTRLQGDWSSDVCSSDLAAVEGATEPEQDDRLPPPPAKPASAAVDEATLLALCHEVGLARRADDVRRCARGSVRLTRGDATSRSRLGGVPDLPPGFVWPSWHGCGLGFLAQLDLAAVAAGGPTTILPR